MQKQSNLIYSFITYINKNKPSSFKFTFMKKQFYLLAILFFSSFCFTNAYCQLNVYVKFDGITGNSTDKEHINEFLVTSFETTDSLSMNATGGGGAGAGKVNFGTAKLQKLLDPATNPTIMADMASGKFISTVTISWYKTGANGPSSAYYQIVLSQVSFQSVSILSPSCASGNCNNLFEEIHLLYGKIQWKGSTTSPTGSPTTGPTTGWDITTNKSL